MENTNTINIDHDKQRPTLIRSSGGGNGGAPVESPVEAAILLDQGLFSSDYLEDNARLVSNSMSLEAAATPQLACSAGQALPRAADHLGHHHHHHHSTVAVFTDPTVVTDNGSEFLQAAKTGDLSKIIAVLETGTVDINTNLNGLNALHLAAKEGHVDVVLELLNRGIRVDAVTKKRNTALHIAALAGQLKVARILLNHGAYANSQSMNGFTPLYMAAQENHADVVSLLLCLGADQNLSTDDGFTPIVVALQQGHKKIVEMLFENDSKSRVKLPALHIAAKKNDVQSACLLLDAAVSKSSAGETTAIPAPDDAPTAERDLQSQLVNCISKNGLTPLHIAAHYGHAEIAELLISRNADVNFVAQQSITPLHVAAKWGRDNLVRLLLHYNAHIDARTQDGLTPLHCAAKAGHENVVDTLMEHGAPITSRTKNGLTALHMAAQGDHDLAAKVLLSYKSSIVDQVTSDYLTALHVAAHCGSANVARLLLERGSSVDAAALNGFTPLHIACKKGRFALVLLLLNAGADVHARTESGLTALHVSSFVGAVQISQLLIENGADCESRTIRGETPLHLACRANQLESLRCLVQTANANVNAEAVCEATETSPRTGDHQTPLHVATSLGFTKCMQFLLTSGAQVNAMTKSGFTSLHLSAKQGNVEAAGVLMDKGALSSINSCVKGQTGLSALHFASKYGHVKFVSLLLHKGAQPDIRGRNGLCPLHIAAHYDHANVALVLLRSGASPHCQALNGYTALHIAARRSHLEITSILFEYNVHVNAASLAGFNALHLACQFGHQDMIAMLLDHQANVNSPSINGLTPLHLCAQENHAKCGELLVKRNANIDAKTKAGYTPLHVAAHFGHLQIVKFFVHLEANVDSRTRYGYTPLHCSAQQNHLAIVKFLLEHGANPNIKSGFGQTALDIAKGLGFVEIFEELKAVVTYIDTENDTNEEFGVQNLMCIRRRKSLEEHKQSMPSDTGDADDRFDPHHSTSVNLRRTESESALGRQDEQSKMDISDETGSYIALELSDLKGDASFRTRYLFKPQQPEKIQEEQPLMDSSEDEDCGYITSGASREKRYQKHKRAKRFHTHDSKERTRHPAVPADPTATTISGTSLSQPYTSSMDGFDGISLDIKQTNEQHMQMDRLLRRRDNDDIIGEDISDSDTDYDDDHMTTVPTSEKPQPSSPAGGKTATILDNLSTMDKIINQNILVRLNARQASMRDAYSHRSEPRHNFLVSFIANAQGGEMIGSRYKNFRFIIPPKSASCPTRITCRILKVPTFGSQPSAAESGVGGNNSSSAPNTRLVSFDRTTCPPLNDGEGLACGVIELNPLGYRFLSPICLEVPHSAALHSGQREIVVFRSDNGEKWEEHTCNHKMFMGPDDSDTHVRVARIVTDDLPRYFALVTRLAFDSYNVDECGRTISSTFVPKAMVVIPEKALVKAVKVSLQAITVEPAAATMGAVGALYLSLSSNVPEKRLIDHFLGKNASLSPIVTVEPRRRKFHKPITIIIPLPSALCLKGSLIGRTAADVRSLRLFCSITGVSARFWLIDAPELIPKRNSTQDANNEAGAGNSVAATSSSTLVKQVQLLYRELMVVPYMVTMVVFAKVDDNLGNSGPRNSAERFLTIRLMCLSETWDIENLLERKENFKEVVRSKEVELINRKSIRVEYRAEDNSTSEQNVVTYQMPFVVFTQNRFEFNVPEPNSAAAGVISLYQPRFEGDEKSPALCHMAVRTPETVLAEKSPGGGYPSARSIIKRIGDGIGDDCLLLAKELGVTSVTKDSSSPPGLAVIKNWLGSQLDRSKLKTLEGGLAAIGYHSLASELGSLADGGTTRRRISDAGRHMCCSEDDDDDDDDSGQRSEDWDRPVRGAAPQVMSNLAAEDPDSV